MVKNKVMNENEGLAPMNEINGNPVVTHDEYLNMKIDDAINAKIKLMNINKIELGCSILDKRVVAGRPKKDSNGVETGEYWSDSYIVDLSFEGGKFSVRVDESTFNLLETDGTRYIAKGVIESRVNDFGYFSPGVKINSFERLF
jgi:hypothetical protein